jgi:GNAT superfamily N-acetyltransferase
LKDEIVIRPLRPEDARDAAALSTELGYQVTEEVMEARLHQRDELPQHVIFAACLNDRVVGWIDVGIVYHLQSGSYGEIGGLVVIAALQGRGIGRRLVEKAEEWTASQGVEVLLVRSRVSRERAHQFYLKQKFSQVKTSAVFTKLVRERLPIRQGAERSEQAESARGGQR